MPNSDLLNAIKMPEILAPAGSFEAVEAAVRCGADAVYLGAKEFSARASAQNFDEEELKKTIAYCHDRDVNVHLAINTAVYDRELDSAARLIEFAASSGIDALIVSDLGILSIAKKICPSLSLHASTQMGIASESGVLAARDLGFERAVLARELSREEIKEIAEKNIIETEVFVHGALCMSVSGQCFLSSVIGRRSGNRGRCAQPCRLECGVDSKNGHALSLKDLSLYSHLRELASFGVSSFKIEGRMKRPEYVAAAVSLARASLLGEDYKEIFELSRDIFSRSGFTEGYYNSQIDKKMFGFREKEDVERAKTALPKLHELYRREISKVPLSAQIKIIENEPITLKLSDNKGNFVEVSAPYVSGNTAEIEAVKDKISRLGQTPYYVDDFKVEIKNAAAPPSVLNALRREAAEKLSEMRTRPKVREIFSAEPLVAPLKSKLEQRISARFESIEQLLACAECCDEIIFPIRKLISQKDKIPQNLYSKIAAELDRFAFSNDKFTQTALGTIKEMGIERVVVQNISQLPLVQNEGLKITFGPFMNASNSRALKTLLENGVDRAIASFELSQKSLGELLHFGEIGALVYGYLPLMITRACPKKTVHDCKNCSAKQSYLVDRKGAKMPIVCRGSVSEILNSVPLCAQIENDEFKALDFLLLYFTLEGPEDCKNLLKSAKMGKLPEIKGGFTRGLYKNGAI